MIRRRLTRDLACLASKEYQTQYIVRGDRRCYVLPEEMLEGAEQVLKTVLENDVLMESFTESERIAVKQCLDELLQIDLLFDDCLIDKEELIFRNESWAAARRSAQKLLVALDVPVSEFDRLANE